MVEIIRKETLEQKIYRPVIGLTSRVKIPKLAPSDFHYWKLTYPLITLKDLYRTRWWRRPRSCTWGMQTWNGCLQVCHDDRCLLSSTWIEVKRWATRFLGHLPVQLIRDETTTKKLTRAPNLNSILFLTPFYLYVVQRVRILSSQRSVAWGG